jgi:hypothetical protein
LILEPRGERDVVDRPQDRVCLDLQRVQLTLAHPAAVGGRDDKPVEFSDEIAQDAQRAVFGPVGVRGRLE